MYLEFEIRRSDCAKCGKLKTEKIPFLANNPFYTERFAQSVDQRCRSASIQSVTKELGLDWQTVKALEMDYMRQPLACAGPPTPRAIGIDEISIRKAEYARLTGEDCRYIKGQKYTLLSHRENLSLEGRKALKQLLAADESFSSVGARL